MNPLTFYDWCKTSCKQRMQLYDLNNMQCLNDIETFLGTKMSKLSIDEIITNMETKHRLWVLLQPN